MKTEDIKVADLKPYERNAKKHDDKQIRNVMESIRQFGFAQPIVCDKNNIVIIGHCRLIAAKRLGLRTVPVLRMEELTEEQAQKLRLLDNKLNESEWDMELLAEDIPELDWSAFDIDWGLSELEEYTQELIEDEVPEVPEEPKAKVGDIYQLGEHRLICGDSTDVAVISSLMNGIKADMVFTDPPYNCNYGNIKHPKFRSREIKNDNMDAEAFRGFCIDFIMNIKEFATGCVYMCAGQGKDGRIMFTVADELLNNSTTIIWNKDHFTLGRGKYQNKYEPIWFGWVESGKDFCDDRTLSNVWDIKRPMKSELHPTMKPIELIATALNHNPKSKTVLDLFGGSGSTLIACEQLGRKCYMCELDPHYVDVIVERWENLTGRKAVKQNG